MQDFRRVELSKERVAEIRTTDIMGRAAIGVFAFWMIWVFSSLLIHIFK